MLLIDFKDRQESIGSDADLMYSEARVYEFVQIFNHILYIQSTLPCKRIVFITNTSSYICCYQLMYKHIYIYIYIIYILINFSIRMKEKKIDELKLHGFLVPR